MYRDYVNHASRLPIPRYDGRLFFWRDRHGVIEASQLRPPMYARVFNDAYDVGFEVISPKTGQVQVFFLHEQVFGDDRQLQCTKFTNADLHDPITINVWND